MSLLEKTSGKRYLLFASQNYSYAILRPIQSAIKRFGGEVKWFLQGNEIDKTYLHDDELSLSSIDEIRDWKPDAVFAPSNNIPTFFPGWKVAVFHGFDAGKVNRKGQNDHYKIRGCFDLYCTQGPNTTEPFQQMAEEMGFFRVRETGWSTLDPLFTDGDANPYVDHNDARPTLLICSTFSKRLSLALKLEQQIRALRDSKKYRILVQFHPKISEETVSQYKAMQNDDLTFVETDDVLPLLKAADVMLCDTSSIMLMFLLLRKPVVTFDTQVPKPHLLNITDPEKVSSAIAEALTYPANLMTEIEQYCQQLHPYSDGQSSYRVLEATNDLIESAGTELKKKPLNLVRQLKFRKKLNYWKW
ncbi:CDP-glycerol glycerophosphotransferase family protein (plasmid) [Pseudoalteromonas sp. T1lg65]|uniref:CDP-glycerol glycerophosphotransferase family protein n=1 Tax=Pseudoalteromonas sp. T1lg65 TaxID=2077101 RepID=UPI003F7A6818